MRYTVRNINFDRIHCRDKNIRIRTFTKCHIDIHIRIRHRKLDRVAGVPCTTRHVHREFRVPHTPHRTSATDKAAWVRDCNEFNKRSRRNGLQIQITFNLAAARGFNMNATRIITWIKNIDRRFLIAVTILPEQNGDGLSRGSLITGIRNIAIAYIKIIVRKLYILHTFATSAKIITQCKHLTFGGRQNEWLTQHPNRRRSPQYPKRLYAIGHHDTKRFHYRRAHRKTAISRQIANKSRADINIFCRHCKCGLIARIPCSSRDSNRIITIFANHFNFVKEIVSCRCCRHGHRRIKFCRSFVNFDTTTINFPIVGHNKFRVWVNNRNSYRQTGSIATIITKFLIMNQHVSAGTNFTYASPSGHFQQFRSIDIYAIINIQGIQTCSRSHFTLNLQNHSFRRSQEHVTINRII